ncbi:MAG: GNAT family acetyltransferase [bacterium]|nr:GNAT family acetyltransferase [bacterium]MCM1376348.1 GNAT family acetyltransferase [Muribaculum sp.]
MLIKDKYVKINIREYLALGTDDDAGEPALDRLLSDFSCPKNPDVELFLKKSAIEFTKKNQSVTYLVLSVDKGELLGYFTIALKPLTVRDETVSNTVKRKIKRISEFDEQTKSYTMAAYLIAQIGKNYTNDACERITGSELLELAWGVIEEMQYRGGGMVVFLEANDEERLLAFYQNNKFRQFDTRLTVSHAENQHELIQLLRLL